MEPSTLLFKESSKTLSWAYTVACVAESRDDVSIWIITCLYLLLQVCFFGDVCRLWSSIKISIHVIVIYSNIIFKSVDLSSLKKTICWWYYFIKKTMFNLKYFRMRPSFSMYVNRKKQFIKKLLLHLTVRMRLSASMFVPRFRVLPLSTPHFFRNFSYNNSILIPKTLLCDYLRVFLSYWKCRYMHRSFFLYAVWNCNKQSLHIRRGR